MDSAKSINGVFNILTDKIITLDELTRISPCNRHETIKIMSRLVSHGAVERLENDLSPDRLRKKSKKERRI